MKKDKFIKMTLKGVDLTEATFTTDNEQSYVDADGWLYVKDLEATSVTVTAKVGEVEKSVTIDLAQYPNMVR